MGNRQDEQCLVRDANIDISEADLELIQVRSMIEYLDVMLIMRRNIRRTYNTHAMNRHAVQCPEDACMNRRCALYKCLLRSMDVVISLRFP
jgi:hypothetical protein